MKKNALILGILVFVMGISMASCSYKGECTCGNVTVEGEYDNKDDYDDAKAACELADCEWKKKL